MFNRIEDRLIFLSDCPGIGSKTIAKVLQVDHTLEQIFLMSSSDLQTYFKLSLETVNHLKSSSSMERHLHRLDTYVQHGVRLITIFDEEYPSLLNEIYDPPFVLYIKGNAEILKHSKTISVVGTREPSSNGIQSLRKIIAPMIEQGWTVISGLAYGIDICSHQLAMKMGGETIAVLGSGFNHIYPREHQKVAREIGMKHLLISEYPPDQKPAKWQFPQRNRIISGLSRGTLIVEAREKSGSLITGDQALQQGRDVFAVPGSILEPRTAGTHRLIQQGAKLTMCAEDILEELNNFYAFV